MLMNLLKRLAPTFKPSGIRERIPVIEGGHQAGVFVSHETAMTIATVFRCVHAVSDALSGIDWRVKKTRADGGCDIQLSHRVDRILRRKVNPIMTSFTFKELMISWALLWGNGFAWIERNKKNEVVAMWPIPPWRVQVRLHPDWGLAYIINNQSADPTVIEYRNMFHLKGLGENGIEGYSVVTLARRSLGSAIAVEQYGASLFSNAARPSGVLEHPGKLSPEAKDALRDDWNRRFQGPGKAWGTAVLQEGMKYSILSMSAIDAQFLESRKFDVTEVCRWIGVHPNIAYDQEGMKYNNTEQVYRHFHSDALAPWAKRLELEADDKLLGQDVLFSEFDFRQLLRGDSLARASVNASEFDRGVLSPNEWRRREGDNPIAGGDEHFVSTSLQTLTHATKEPEPVPAPLVQDADGDGDANDQTKDAPTSDQDELSSLRGLLADGVLRTFRRQKRIAEQTGKANVLVADFEAAMVANIAADEKKMLGDVRAAIGAVGVFACGQPWGWWGDYTLAAFIKMLTPSMLKLSVAAFESGDVSDYIGQRETGLANAAADTLLKASLVAAKSAKSMEGHYEQN